MNEAKTGDNITLFFIEIFIASGRILLTFCKKADKFNRLFSLCCGIYGRLYSVNHQHGTY
ncbi:hypothetical protein X874_5350 [Mannheimia varigena USDA-ARS-USMARC-1312]|nr:hypothetical protein X874_5350 [Mannheimia varigena USDA-ARS-USMARC-1312]